MNEAEWNTCTDSTTMLEFLRDKLTDRKLRLFACACCRRVWHLFKDEACEMVVEASEHFADRPTTGRQLTAASRKAREALDLLQYEASVVMRLAKYAARDMARVAVLCGDKRINVIEILARIRRVVTEFTPHMPKSECPLLRDIANTPFHPLPLAPSWRTATVLALTQAAYAERILPAGTLDTSRLAVLADALEEAGCTDAAILSHLRSPGPHIRGCWPVDLLLAKE